MNRRRFLGLLAGAGAATVVTHFLPPVGGWHSDFIYPPPIPYEAIAFQRALNHLVETMSGVPQLAPNIWYCHPKMYDAIVESGLIKMPAKKRIAVGDFIAADPFMPEDAPPFRYPNSWRNLPYYRVDKAPLTYLGVQRAKA